MTPSEIAIFLMTNHSWWKCFQCLILGGYVGIYGYFQFINILITGNRPTGIFEVPKSKKTSFFKDFFAFLGPHKNVGMFRVFYYNCI